MALRFEQCSPLAPVIIMCFLFCTAYLITEQSIMKIVDLVYYQQRLSLFRNKLARAPIFGRWILMLSMITRNEKKRKSQKRIWNQNIPLKIKLKDISLCFLSSLIVVKSVMVSSSTAFSPYKSQYKIQQCSSKEFAPFVSMNYNSCSQINQSFFIW